MTLATVPRYDREAVPVVGDHAVVVGGSMAGLFAARVLADGFETVTIIEKDTLPDQPTARRGVPQGSHAHAMQEAGRATLEDLFPGTARTSLRPGGWWSMQRGISTSTTRAISSPTVRTGYQPTVLLDRFSNTWFEGASLTSMGSTCDPVASSRTTSSTTLGRPWRGWSSVTMGPQRKGFVSI